ncbi:hypothetical protein KEM52_001673 [Ascosphaera acerosa]|nr:hypothetical protein KEM52_001673 [Ascosphaera acerosa]
MWKPYDLYGRVDHMYGWPEYRAGNGLTMAQSILSLAEVAGYLYYLTTIWRHSAATRQTRSLRAADAQRRSLFERAGSCASRWLLASQNSLGGRPGVVALLVVFAASIMALNRAVLYLLLQPCSRYRDIGHNEPAIAFFLWLVPNTLRVLLPAYAAYYFASEILNALETVTGVPARERAGRIKTL